MDSVKITAEYLKTANYALFHNRIPICQSVEVTNVSDAPVENLVINCSGEFIADYQAEIARINPGETIRLTPFNVNPDASKLAAITERAVTDFKLTAVSGSETLGETVCEIELMPYDHWTGTRIMPQTIVSFITPNNPAISNLVVKAAAQLKNLTGSSSFSEYQSGNTNTVREQVAAVFAALHELGIVYRGLSASYETVGQRITMPDQVITSKIGNCLELTLLMASVLEAVGINTVIVFEHGHAYLGVWLVDDCYPCSVSDDPAFIEKKCSRGIDEMIVLECTHLAQENVSFEQALHVAENSLADHKAFEMFVDVKRSRLERIFPLPSRIEQNGVWTIETDGIDHDSCITDVKQHDRYDLNRISESSKELTKYDIWERKLLDFSLRNSLLNLSVRRRAVQFISFDVNKIEDNLQEGQEYCLMPKPNVEIKFESDEKLIRSKLYEQLHDLIVNDMEHNQLHTFLPEGETRSILKTIYRTARCSIEETGANSLFLVIGTLRWFETDQSATPRYAPLLLLPVEMVYKKGNFYVRTRDEEITLNITLIEFLRQNYDITFNGLDPLPLDKSGVDVPLIFALIRDALKDKKRWDVEEECLLGTFSFSKFLMWNDVHSHREQLSQNNIISSLVANRLTWTPTPMVSNLKDIDMQMSPVDTAIPVAVDSSQMAAVLEGGEGHSFILYGPPGTGKSQTITNLIANALFHGKRVLFVAEKMAALSVVQSRLAKIGLDPFCLELHSNKSTKRHVLQQLEKALNVVHIVAPAEHGKQADKIFSERKALISYINALHTPNPSDGLSVYDCIVRYESISGEPLPGFKYDEAIDSLLLAEGSSAIDELLGSRLTAVVKLVGSPSAHPLVGLTLDRSMLTDGDAIAAQLKKDSDRLIDLCKTDFDKLAEAKTLREKLLRNNAPALLDRDPDALNQQWRAAKAKWFIPRFFAKRKFIKELKQYNPYVTPQEVDALIDDLTTYRNRHDRIESLHKILEHNFKASYEVDEVPDASFIEKSAAKLAQWSDHSSLMRDWYHWSELSGQLRDRGMGCVVRVLESQDFNVSDVRNAYLKALFRHKAQTKIGCSEVLSTFEGMLFDEKTATYRQLTENFQILTQKELYARLASRIPMMTDDSVTGSEIGLLKRNISNGGRGLSLRDLFDQLPTLMPRLCPCVLMSPMSVAQYIDLSADKFDLVVFDEASQMPTSEAVGAIARGKALIVVGDPKQMPPTSFFSSANVDAEEASIDDMESILEDCRTLDIPSLQLSWHYRSRHESLIAFSNMEYYDGSLITFPSVDDKSTKVHFVPVTGFYDKGGKRCNKAEAEAIVNEIVRRLRDDKLQKQSIGVIAFSVMQQGLIEDILQETLEKDKSLQDAAAAMYEPIFVKNLENVQGDERDVILFSIGYGPDKDGKVSMNFGPLNNAGGERRLNVAVSRARQEMYIFSTLKSADIDLRRSKARGVEGLKHFLQYAETQILPSTLQAGVTKNSSVIAEQIAAELCKRGYAASTNIGRSHFRVDVAIEDAAAPGTYSLGILLDGEGYRDTHTTRDREVVQPSVLGSLRWKIMRVWSVDWFNNRERVISRIIEKLERNDGDDTPPSSPQKFDPLNEKVTKPKSNLTAYKQYETTPSRAEKMSELDLMNHIVACEQPITPTLVCRRIASLRGGRMTQALQDTVKLYINLFFIDGSGALWTDDVKSQSYPYYRQVSERDIADVPEIEIINAIKETLEEQLSLDEDGLTQTASRKMGFSPRRGTLVDAVFRDAVAKLKAESYVEIISDKLRLK